MKEFLVLGELSPKASAKNSYFDGPTKNNLQIINIEYLIDKLL